MQLTLTTQQLHTLAQDLVCAEGELSDNNLPTLGMVPRLVSCDGPGLELVLAYDTKRWMTNPLGAVHGGVVAILLDNVMGIFCNCLCRNGTPTINMTLNYPRPVPLDATVHIRTHLLVFGRTCSQLTAQLYLPEDPQRVLAYATGVYSTKDHRDLSQL